MSTAKLWFVRQTESARLYSKLPRSRNPERSDEVWIPISQIEHTTRHPSQGEEWPVHIVKIPDWLAEKHSI